MPLLQVCAPINMNPAPNVVSGSHCAGGWAAMPAMSAAPHTYTTRVNQIYFEPILFARAAANPRIRILNRTCVEHVAETSDWVSLSARNLDSGEVIDLTGGYLVGCAQGHRRQAERGRGHSARTVNLLPGPDVDRADHQTECLDELSLPSRARRESWLPTSKAGLRRRSSMPMRWSVCRSLTRSQASR
jgi:hypothetical protein